MRTPTHAPTIVALLATLTACDAASPRPAPPAGRTLDADATRRELVQGPLVARLGDLESAPRADAPEFTLERDVTWAFSPDGTGAAELRSLVSSRIELASGAEPMTFLVRHDIRFEFTWELDGNDRLSTTTTRRARSHAPLTYDGGSLDAFTSSNAAFAALDEARKSALLERLERLPESQRGDGRIALAVLPPEGQIAVFEITDSAPSTLTIEDHLRDLIFTLVPRAHAPN